MKNLWTTLCIFIGIFLLASMMVVVNIVVTRNAVAKSVDRLTTVTDILRDVQNKNIVDVKVLENELGSINLKLDLLLVKKEGH